MHSKSATSHLPSRVPPQGPLRWCDRIGVEHVTDVLQALHTASGYLLTPWLTSRTSRMNAVTVFVGVLAWGWLWGFWGLLLGMPILMAVKAVCDRVDDLKPVGELLGR